MPPAGADPSQRERRRSRACVDGVAELMASEGGRPCFRMLAEFISEKAIAGVIRAPSGHHRPTWPRPAATPHRLRQLVPARHHHEHRVTMDRQRRVPRDDASAYWRNGVIVIRNPKAGRRYSNDA